MSEIRQRLEAHRNDALVLLGEISHTARLLESFRLSGAVGHLARVQVLLSEELEGLSGMAKQEPASFKGGGEVREDDTPADGIRLATSRRHYRDSEI
jgi:hypothetical protein